MSASRPTSPPPGRPGAGRRRAAGLCAALCALALGAGACGIPYNSAPQPLSQPLPAQLYSTPPTVTTTLPSSCRRCTYTMLYFVENSQLAGFRQEIPLPVTLSHLLQALESGPSRADEGLRVAVSTDIPLGSNLQAIGISGRTADIGLDAAYYGLTIFEEELELGQIVYSVMQAEPGLRGVQFFHNGSPVLVVNASGQTVSGTVNEYNYCTEAIQGCPPPAGSS